MDLYKIKSDLIKMKSTIIILVSILLFITCNKKDFSKHDIKAKNLNYALQFKYWLKDTVNYIRSQNKNVKIIIPSDSTYLELHKKYNLKMNPNNFLKNQDLEIAVTLLKINDSIPKNEFNLSFDINYFFDIGSNNKIYVYEYELENFIVTTSYQRTYYTFVRGNLIEKKIVKNK